MSSNRTQHRDQHSALSTHTHTLPVNRQCNMLTKLYLDPWIREHLSIWACKRSVTLVMSRHSSHIHIYDLWNMQKKKKRQQINDELQMWLCWTINAFQFRSANAQFGWLPTLLWIISMKSKRNTVISTTSVTKFQR